MDFIGFWIGSFIGIGFFSATPAFFVVSACTYLIWRERRWSVFLAAYLATIFILGLVNGAIMIYIPNSESAIFTVIIGPLIVSILSLAWARRYAREKDQPRV